ncbi:hypothetical protein [Clostridium sp. DJ247]|uniref:hypothetical protein n=1 Tax=Clostridium sp. DJ247 TaxID=2726188 RepID=UPI001F4CFE9F|nr:hypothetical protein [Clostridium sp. DJ247]
MKKTKRLYLTLFIILMILLGYTCAFRFSNKNIVQSPAPNNIENLHNTKSKISDEIPVSVLKVLNSYDDQDSNTDTKNKDLRKFPYPYDAMLAICSDIDDTTSEEFRTYHKFLNTKAQTPYGEGLGLDIGDSMWLYMADNMKGSVDKYGNSIENTMTFFKGTDKTQKHDADEIIHFINAGWIDSLHTFGDFSTENEKSTLFNRKLAVDAWETYKSINFKTQVWINHGNTSNEQNFGAYGTTKFMSYQQGDNPKSPHYHTDLTLGNGIKYVWNSISDYSFGQDYPLYEITLRDNKKVWGFYRYTNNLTNGKIHWTWTPENIYRQLTQENLDNLIKNKQYSIVAQHFGVDAENLFTEANIKSLRRLKNYESNGKILVAKTSRLLNYANIHKYVTYKKVTEGGKTYININYINDPIFGKFTPTLENIRGLTFYCDDAENTALLLNGSNISADELQINPKDDTGKLSISIKWFTADYTDYTT